MPEFSAGQHQMDARRGQCRLDRGDREAGVREGRAEDISVKHAGRRDVVGVAALAGNEGLVFQAKDGSAHPEFRRDDRHLCLARLD
jgi:hypothetical protein